MSILRSIVLVADASESASALWTETTKTIAALMAQLPTDSVLGVHLLGTRQHWEADDWRADVPLLPEAARSGSFVAPVMAALRARQESPEAIIIIGAGEVFDLTDWVGNGVRWAVVRVGGESWQGTTRHTLEVTPEATATLYERLQASVPTFQPVRAPEGFVKHQWELDRVGYPMVYVPPLNAHIHLFPVAKPQFEQFLVEEKPGGCGDSWYADLLRLNPRLSPAAASLAEYEQLFITGLLPDDVQNFVRWQGQDFNVLTPEQWKVAFQWMEEQDASVRPVELRFDPVACRLWDGLLAELHPQTLLDLSLMRNGVVEWVKEPGGVWLGMGQPREAFYPNFHDALRDKPFEPTSLTRRSRLFGLRLMRSA